LAIHFFDFRAINGCHQPPQHTIVSLNLSFAMKLLLSTAMILSSLISKRGRALGFRLVVNNNSQNNKKILPPSALSPRPRIATSPPSTTTARDMCGLVAAVQDVWTSAPNSSSAADHSLFHSDVLYSTTQILTHRGPDGIQCTATSTPHTDHGKNWGMGHTRLAIVDPSNRAADMPFQLQFSHDTVHHLAANGEIYNHDELYQEMVNTQGWQHKRMSGSDCEVIAHAYHVYGGPTAVTKLDGMFAFVIFEQDADTKQIRHAFAARDPVGIKPLYYGKSNKNGNSSSTYVFASELKALVGHVDPETVVAIPAGHYWTPETGLVCYYNPDWLRRDDYAPWKEQTQEEEEVTGEMIRTAFTKAVQKRMMADVEYGFFLSGGIDSCVVAHTLMPLYRKEREKMGDYRPIHTYTVGMENSPDVMAARGMVEALGGSEYINHHVRTFTPDEVFDLIPKIVYHMETYEAELIRSSIPNWLLAERAAQDVKMVLTGEGADELFAGYLYFQDAENPQQLQDELRRIYGMLGNINLHRTDRMTMAHGLEARVPFLDTEFTRLVMSVDPAKKMVDPEAVRSNARGREKTLLRELFEGPNENGDSIPRPVLWRAKAMQCEGVGEDWVSILQNKIASLVTDEEMANAHITYPVNTPHTKEELYYRRIFDEHYHGMEHVVKLWEGGGRAMGAAWKSDMYTREGLKNVNLLSHALQNSKEDKPSRAEEATNDATTAAMSSGYSEFEGLLTAGGDDRSLINKNTRTNKYHIRPQPIKPGEIFRGSCTGNPPTVTGYAAAKELYDNKLVGRQGEDLDQALREVFADQRARIAKVLDLPKDAEVILCPSGSDAEYIPVAIARTLRPDAKLSVYVSQLKEIGAGSAPAATGKYFSRHAPLIGRIPEDTIGLSGFDNIESEIIHARESDGSAVLDASKRTAEFLEESFAEGWYPILHGVFGGKTGLRCETMPPSLQGGNKSLGVVDACQGRFTKAELREWLDQDSIVLFTGSKFYQAPPFCGAVIVPGTIAEKLRQASTDELGELFSEGGLGGFLSDKEIPESLSSWASKLARKGANNIGLALRWEAGLAAMESLSSVSDDAKDLATEYWAQSVGDMVEAEPSLDLWCVERSILSVRVAKKGGGGWLNMNQLRDLFKWMSMDVSDLVPDASPEERTALATTAYIGQPVDVSESYGIVRIALGAESMLPLFDEKKRKDSSKRDALVVKKLAAIAKHFDTLKKGSMLESSAAATSQKTKIVLDSATPSVVA
jgi:asparagine synthase (glutamine-hydrolysing)